MASKEEGESLFLSREEIITSVKKINSDKFSLSDEQLLELLLSFVFKDKLNEVIEQTKESVGDISSLLEPDALCLYFGKNDENVMAFLKIIKIFSERFDNVSKSDEVKYIEAFVKEKGGYGNCLVNYIGHGLLEELCVIYLEENNHILEVKKYSELERGGVDACVLDAVKRATQNNASKLIVGHNHPSGSLDCSESDLLIIHVFFQHLRSKGITLQKHYVVNHEGYKILYSEEDS